MASFNNFSKNFTRDIDRAVEKAFDDGYLNQVGRQIVNQIQVRTRAGFGVTSNNARQRRLRPLSGEYVEARRFARTLGILSPTTTPRRSNLTFSGNMLESIKHKLVRGGLSFEFTNRLAEETAEEVQSKGRPFFNLSSTEITKLTRQFNTRLRNILIRV